MGPPPRTMPWTFRQVGRQGILTGPMNLYVLFGTECFFQWKCWFFWLQAFWKTVLLPFFHVNLYVFLRQNCIFQESVWFFGFRHFARRFCGLFSYECIRFLETELFFQWACSVCFCSGRYLFLSIFRGQKKQIHRILPPDPPSSNSNQKSIEKLIFAAFGKILLLAKAFFYSNSNWKSIEKLIFPAFGKILVVANAFVYSKSFFSKYWKFKVQLLARSWFWGMLFSFQILIEQLIFSAFGKILVLANAFSIQILIQ